jgi:hypothetical protein
MMSGETVATSPKDKPIHIQTVPDGRTAMMLPTLTARLILRYQSRLLPNFHQ